MVETAGPLGTTAVGTVDDRAVKSIANSEYFRFLGEEKIRKVATAVEGMGNTELFNRGRWVNPSLRIEIFRILGPELPQVSETYAYMVVRRYKDLKRFYKEEQELAEKKRIEDEAKAKLAAEKAAKAAAAKAKAPAPAAAPAADAAATPEPKKP